MLSYWTVFSIAYMFLYSVIYASCMFWFMHRHLKRLGGGKNVLIVCPNCNGLGKVNLTVSQVWVDCTMCGGKKYIERFIP